MTLCRGCRVHVHRDHPYCLHCGALRSGVRLTEFVAPELRAARDPANGLALAAPVTTIGRDPANDLVLDHASVSRRHAEVRRTPSGFTIADLGSVNGVEVDGAVVERDRPLLLADTSTVHVGDVELRFAQPRGTRLGSRTEVAATNATMLAVAGAQVPPTATEPLTATPRRRGGWALKQVPAGPGQAPWVLRSSRTSSYLELDDRDVFLWRRIDGRSSVRDLLFDYANTYGELALPRIERTLRTFTEAGLVSGLPDTPAAERSRWSRVGGALLRSRWAISGIDARLGRAYRSFGWWFFTPLGVLVVAALAAGGGPGFVLAAQRHDLFDVRGAGVFGVLAGVLAFLAALVLHEAAHAFAVKSYGRRVTRAGFMFVLGMPFAFVDTSDMWFGSRASRVVVALSGPISTLALAGALAAGAAFLPDPAWSAVLFHIVIGLYLNTAFNLNPFAPLDGYQAIADALRRPRLREEALAYAFRGLWIDLRARRRPNLAALGLALYGLLAVVVLVALLVRAVALWRPLAGRYVQQLLPPPWDVVAFCVLLLLVTSPVWIRIARRSARTRRERRTESEILA